MRVAPLHPSKLKASPFAGMEFMTKRDPHARDGVGGSMMGAFDFDQPARAPLILTKNACP